jgi:hypothetical protein
MRLVCFCSKCKQGKPYDMVVSLRGERGDICMDCLSDKSDSWIECNVISRHQWDVWEHRNKRKREAQDEPTQTP